MEGARRGAITLGGKGKGAKDGDFFFFDWHGEVNQ